MTTRYSCRHCRSSLDHQVIDLGHQPPSNAYLSFDQLVRPEQTYPLRLLVCTKCWLVQLPAHASADTLFTPDYAYFSSTSTSWCDHAKRFVSSAVERLGLGPQSQVLELASNDGYLLQFVQQQGIPCLGIEPTRATAEAARAKGIPTVERFFGLDLAQDLDPVDLLVANNVLAHVPDINDFLSGIALVLKPSGLASIEFPHLLRLLKCNQFDTIYHEHYSYLSLRSVERMASSVGLILVDVEELPTHGGSLRLWLAPRTSGREASAMVEAVRMMEDSAGLESLSVWADFERSAITTKNNLLRFLLAENEAGRPVYGYGAAAKGNTLLNYAGVRGDLLIAVADRAASKQGKFLPGSHIPVISPEELAVRDPKTLLVLPWNLIDEVVQQWPGHRLFTAIPDLKVWD
jgi:SAM-dependent methyltransferase